MIRSQYLQSEQFLIMEKLTSFIPVIGPVVAAALTAAIAFVVSVLAKENKTSEFRQAWIEGLRNDIAELLGVFNTLETSLTICVGNVESGEEKQNKYNEFHSDNRGDYAKIDTLCNRVVLRLNPSEHALLIQKIRILKDSVGHGSNEAHRLCIELVDDFSKIFKAEWGRVKDGETTFKVMKAVALVIVLAILLVGLIFSFFSIFAK